MFEKRKISMREKLAHYTQVAKGEKAVKLNSKFAKQNKERMRVVNVMRETKAIVYMFFIKIKTNRNYIAINHR